MEGERANYCERAFWKTSMLASERSEQQAKRASRNWCGCCSAADSLCWKTSIFAMKCAKWLQILWLHPLLS